MDCKCCTRDCRNCKDAYEEKPKKMWCDMCEAERWHHLFKPSRHFICNCCDSTGPHYNDVAHYWRFP